MIICEKCGTKVGVTGLCRTCKKRTAAQKQMSNGTRPVVIMCGCVNHSNGFITFCPLHQAAQALLAACRAWMKVESEMMDNHPCPDLALRAGYRKQAVALTKAAIRAVAGQP